MDKLTFLRSQRKYEADKPSSSHVSYVGLYIRLEII
jgi:hypothetical protein